MLRAAAAADRDAAAAKATFRRRQEAQNEEATCDDEEWMLDELEEVNAEAEAEADAVAVTTAVAATGPAPVPETAVPPALPTASIRVGVDKVDALINLVGELVITQAMLQQASSVLDPAAFERLHAGLAQLERNTRSLQASVLAVRMLPVGTVFSRFPRLVRDLADKLGKKVRLVLDGEGTELDKGMIERITDPLTHLLRNALDHGLETPAERRAAGKPEEGRLRLSARHASGAIVLEIEDDGRGLNRERIVARALERGVISQPPATDSEIDQLIFEPGFSTAESVTDVSGRGVGMDVVKTKIGQLNGQLSIESELGKGSRIVIKVPLTLAIMPTLMIMLGDQSFALPLVNVVEIFHLDLTKTNIVDSDADNNRLTSSIITHQPSIA